MKTLYETLGGTYREENGRLIPETKLPEKTNYKIGKYGQFYLDYMKNHRRGRYTTLLTEGTLNARLHEIDLEANRMLENIISRLATERGIDENLKIRDMLRWVAEMNNIKASAEFRNEFCACLCYDFTFFKISSTCVLAAIWVSEP